MSTQIDEFLKLSYLMLPLLVGLAVHGVCIKFGWLSWLTPPIDAGATLRGRHLFGENKTWRGVVAVAFGTAIGFGLQVVLHGIGVGRRVELLNYSDPRVVGLGFAMGAAAMLSELPNSFLKRQLEIAPGAPARGVLSGAFYALDQIDMLLGVWLVLGCFVKVTTTRVLASIIFLFVTHQVLTVIGYGLGMRATAR
jgi:hypothetical protein